MIDWKSGIAAVVAAAALTLGGAAADANKKSEKKAQAKVAKVDKTSATKKKAQAKPAAETPAASKTLLPTTAPAVPAATKKIDPLEAALAQAAGHAAAPAAAPKKPVKRKARKGLAELRNLSHAAPGMSLLSSNRDKSVPNGEMVEHMEAARLGQSAINKVIKHNIRYLQYCQQRMIARKKVADGDVSLEFVVEPKGNVSKVEAHASGKDAKILEGCIERRVAKWRFPAADAPTVVAYPLVFDTAREAGKK